MRLGDLVQHLDVGGLDGPSGDVRICDVTDDSRTALPGSLFIAKPGLSVDGRAFIDDAVRAGAAAVLTEPPAPSRRAVPMLTTHDLSRATAEIAERFFGRPSTQLRLCGVTGTNGKSSVAHFVHAMLNRVGVRTGLVGTVLIDDGRETARAAMTTPPAIELSRTLATMVEHGCTAAAIEVSSHALDQGRTDALGFDVAVFTNLSGDHTDYHPTPEHYAAAKARLFETLDADAVAVLNADDPSWERMARDCRARVVTGAGEGGPPADGAWWAGEPTLDGTPARFTGPWGVIDTVIRPIGDYNVSNALLALLAAHAMGVDRSRLPEAVRAADLPPGRLERIRVAGASEISAPVVLVDYAHSDDSLARTLAVTRPIAQQRGGRLIVVFGCGGDRDASKRPRMGRAASRGADLAIITSDNPRTERPSAIIDDILAGLDPDGAPFEVHADRAAAIDAAVNAAGPADVVLIAGKGHEDHQVLPDGRGGSYRIDFDDREHARAALTARAAALASEFARAS